MSYIAQEERKAILDYWLTRNKSKTYSIKLNKLIEERIVLISNNPKIGKATSDKTARISVLKNYLIVCEDFKNKIVILRIWDSRQNPKKT